MAINNRQIENIHYSLKQEINELYVATAIKSFGVGLMAMFGAIFMYEYFAGSLGAVFTFYVIPYIAYVLLLPLVARLMSKVGLKRLMALGNPFIGLYLALLAFAPQGSVLFAGIAVLLKIVYLLLFWPARHTDFAKFASPEKRGRQIGLANILTSLVKVVAPLLGGIIITFFGFPALYVTAAILVVVSSIPLFKSDEVYAKYNLSWSQSWAAVFERHNIRATAAYFFEGVDYYVAGFLLPLFYFFVIGEMFVEEDDDP